VDKELQKICYACSVVSKIIFEPDVSTGLQQLLVPSLIVLHY